MVYSFLVRFSPTQESYRSSQIFPYTDSRRNPPLFTMTLRFSRTGKFVPTILPLSVKTEMYAVFFASGAKARYELGAMAVNPCLAADGRNACIRFWSCINYEHLLEGNVQLDSAYTYLILCYSVFQEWDLWIPPWPLLGYFRISCHWSPLRR